MSVTPLAGWPSLTIEFAPAYSPLDTSPVWRDISTVVRYELETHRGKSNETDQSQPGSMRLVLDNRTRTFDPEYTGSPYYATMLALTGASGSYAWTSDKAALDITGDCDLRARISGDLTPAAQGTIVGKWTTPNFSYILAINTDGTLLFGWSADGTTILTATSTASLTTVAADNTKVHVRGVIDVNNGAAGRTVTFYYSLDNTNDHTTVTWVQLGSAVTTAGVTSIFSGSAILEVGANSTGGSTRFTGNIYYAAVLNGIAGTVVADPNFTINLGAGATSFTDGHSNTWTVNSPATVAADTTVGSYVTPKVPVRFRATYNATTYDVWRGFVQSWEPSYDKNFDAVVTVQCQDLLTLMAQVPTGGGAWRSKMESLNPRAWWRFGDTTMSSGSTVTEVSGAYPGTYSGTPTPATSLIDADDNGAMFTGDGFAILPQTAIPASYGTVAVWFKCPTVSGSDLTFVSFGDSNELQLYIEGSGGSAGRFSVDDYTPFAVFTANTTTRVDDGFPHLAVYAAARSFDVVSGALYIDGVQEATFGGTLALGALDGTGLWAGIRGDGTSLFLNGTIDELAVFDTVLTSTQILDLYKAGHNSWAGEDTGVRATRAATIAGIPSALLDMDTGVSPCEGWTGGTNTLAVAQAADLTEQGLLFVSGAGKVTFVARSALLNLTSSFTVTQALFTDYESDYDASWIKNYADFTSSAGTGSYSDATSIARYGRSGESRTTIDYLQSYLAAGAQYLVQRYKDPKQRITRLTIKPSTSPATLWPQVLGREIGDRVTVTRTPMGVGSAISQDLIIVGVDHTVDQSGWVTTWNLSQADTGNYFALDDASRGLDSTAVLAAF